MADEIILRRWASTIRTEDEEVYARYVLDTGGSDYASTPGNLGFQMTMHALGDGTSQVVTLSWWRSMDDIRGFAGADVERARYYPEDERYLLAFPERVEHHRVVAGATPGGQTRVRSARSDPRTTSSRP